MHKKLPLASNVMHKKLPLQFLKQTSKFEALSQNVINGEKRNGKAPYFCPSKRIDEWGCDYKLVTEQVGTELWK